MTDRVYTKTFATASSLYDLLKARTDLGGAGVYWGYPGETGPPEFIWIGGFESSEQTPRSLGRRMQDESFVLRVYVDIALETADPADANVRAEELVQIIEDTVHQDYTLGGVLAKAGTVEGIDTVIESQPVTDTAYGTVLVVRIACETRT